MIYNIIIIVIGLLVSLFLFNKFPIIRKRNNKTKYKISIIIPARNEEKNIGLLLADLNNQSIDIEEIICVDDCSVDKTTQIISTFPNVKLISIKNKPDGWVGKSWACFEGSKAAMGDLLLFLDSDVRLLPDAICSLVSAYDEKKCVISVIPFHKTEKIYEQFSFFFNIIQVGANGISSKFKSKNAGLYGPVILIPKKTYIAIDGHNSVKGSIVDDIALGETLKSKGFDYRLYMGKGLINYRMYSGGFFDLLNGWTKNYATGAFKTPFYIFIMTFLWITSCALSVISLIQSCFENNILIIATYLLLCIVWGIELYRISRTIGKYKVATPLLYPFYLLFFILIFTRSLIRKVFKKTVVWKGRNIKLE